MSQAPDAQGAGHRRVAMSANSLTFRLLAASSVWIAVALALTGALLVVLFRDHIEHRFEAALSDHMEELAAASETGPSGQPQLTWQPSDPRFNRPWSGWYWQIGRGGGALRSASLWRAILETAARDPTTNRMIVALEGPDGRRLRALVRSITLAGSEHPVLFVVAGPEDDIGRDVRRFALHLSLTLACLAVALIAAVGLQVRFGLRPLADLQSALRGIRAGRARHLPASAPREVQPVVSELNALLDHSRELTERARTQAGNLAHAIRNPLAVIANEARSVDGDHGRVLREAVADIRHSVDRHLSRSRAAGSVDIIGARTVVGPVAADIVDAMTRLYRDRGLRIEADIAPDLCFRGDAGDLEEMLGNLTDNACKWARSTVRIGGRRIADTIVLTVEDDGPGIAPDLRHAALQRGRRLDESTPGAGFGLDIVRDLATLNRGRLDLDRSGSGGLRAHLELPAAERGES